MVNSTGEQILANDIEDVFSSNFFTLNNIFASLLL